MHYIIHICVYVYTYVYIYIYIHTYIYIYIYNSGRRKANHASVDTSERTCAASARSVDTQVTFVNFLR